jgi:hypothetical protein
MAVDGVNHLDKTRRWFCRSHRSRDACLMTWGLWPRTRLHYGISSEYVENIDDKIGTKEGYGNDLFICMSCPLQARDQG